jgi:hypothetical protein
VGSAAAGRKKKLGPWHVEFKLHAVDRAEAIVTVNFTARLVNFTATGSIKFMVGTAAAAAGRKQLGPWHMDCTLDAVLLFETELAVATVNFTAMLWTELAVATVNFTACCVNVTAPGNLNFTMGTAAAGQEKPVPWHMECSQHEWIHVILANTMSSVRPFFGFVGCRAEDVELWLDLGSIMMLM